MDHPSTEKKTFGAYAYTELAGFQDLDHFCFGNHPCMVCNLSRDQTKYRTNPMRSLRDFTGKNTPGHANCLFTTPKACLQV